MATIKDIAGEIGVSHQVVSAVLNNKTNCRVSEKKRSEILQTAKRLGYSKNFGYRLMQGQQTHTVAIMLSEAYIKSEEHFNELIIRLMSKFNQLDYSVYSIAFTYSAEDNLEKIREMISRGVEHFVFLGAPIGYVDVEKEIEKSGRSLVGYGKELKRHVCVDSATGVMTILRFFLNEGRNLRFVCPINLLNANNSRIIALQRLFPKLTFEQIVEQYIITTEAVDFNSANFVVALSTVGWESTARIVKELPEVNALYFMTDNMAVGGANFLVRNGYEVGRDVLVAGFNNIPAVKIYLFPISSVEHDVDRIVDLLVEESLVTTPCQHIIEPIVHIRTK